LDLEEDFYALKGCGNEGHGNSGEEPGGRNLGNGVLRGVVLDLNFGKAADERLS
jgi:hypothetical protein